MLTHCPLEAQEQTSVNLETKIQSLSFKKKTHLQISSAKCQPFDLGLNVLTHCGLVMPFAGWYRSGSTFFLVMASYLMAPSHYHNQYCLVIKGILWHSPENNFIGTVQDINVKNEFENYTFNMISASPWGQRVKFTFAVIGSSTGDSYSATAARAFS